MRKASSSFLVFLFAVLLVSFQAYAQPIRTFSERVQQTLEPYEKLDVADALRLNYRQEEKFEVISLSIVAQSFRGKGQIDVLSRGRVVGSLLIRQKLNDVTLNLTPPVEMENLKLATTDEIFIESISVDVRRERDHGPYRPGPRPIPAPIPAPHPYPVPRPEPRPIPGPIQYERQPMAYSTLRLYGMLESRGSAQFDLDQMVSSQLGYSLAGVELQSITLDGGPAMGGYATVQIMVNNRSMGERQLPSGRNITQLYLNTREEIRDLRLIIRGNARMESVQINVGNVQRYRY